MPAEVLRFDTPVTAIHLAATGGLDVRTSGATVHVILAVPPALALERIDFGAELDRLARATPGWMGAVAKVVARCPDVFWRAEGLAGAAVSRTGPLQEPHDMSGPGGSTAALFGFAAARSVGPGFEQAVTAQPAQLFGPAAAEPRSLHVQDWSGERWTAPATVHHLADHSLFGHPSTADRRWAAGCTRRPPGRPPTTPDTSKAPSPPPNAR
nr:FAD-dependent oxidoreductase [Streptomyces sp. SID13726]